MPSPSPTPSPSSSPSPSPSPPPSPPPSPSPSPSPPPSTPFSLVVHDVLRPSPLSSANRSHQPISSSRLRASAAVRLPAAGRWKRAREERYLRSCASPCIKLKFPLVVYDVLRPSPLSAAGSSHQPSSSSRLRASAAISLSWRLNRRRCRWRRACHCRCRCRRHPPAR